MTPDDLAAIPCVEWAGPRDRYGYGIAPRRRGGESKAHRVAWADAHGPIPTGMSVLHRCDNRACVNVAHLWLGTQADNLADMKAKGRGANRATHQPPTQCVRGHSYTPENTMRPPSGGRQCRACNRIRMAERRARRVV